MIEHTLLAECDSLFKELATMMATRVKSKNAGNMTKKLWKDKKEKKKKALFVKTQTQKPT